MTDETERSERFAQAKARYDAAAEALARSGGRVDEKMLADDEMVVVGPAGRIEVYDALPPGAVWVLDRDPDETAEEYARRREIVGSLFPGRYTSS